MIDYRRFFENLPSPYMMLDRDLRFIDMNARYLETTERKRKDLIGRYVFDVFPESGERLVKFHGAFLKALSGTPNTLLREPFSIERPEAQGGGRREVFWSCHHLPIFDAQGEVCGMAQKAEDVTSEVLAEQMRDVIAREFNHRVRNVLATVSSVARATAVGKASTDVFLKDFYARIDSLSRTHSMLLSGTWQGTDLGELVSIQIAPYRREGASIAIEGPKIELNPRQSQALGMAFHELATNAAKYGALGDHLGSVSVIWSLDNDTGKCRLRWIEAGSRPSPAREGFGSKILCRAVPMELNGSAERRFLQAGMEYELVFPLG